MPNLESMAHMALRAIVTELNTQHRVYCAALTEDPKALAERIMTYGVDQD
jgi:hypothetical protein